ncbi:MAG TPA: hypothetical protein VHK68_11765 [Gemmatimonadales bacterium]|jgi:uncharacterized membrane protein|nr:hypothetical protein [Gemmatimonadales bacterium]
MMTPVQTLAHALSPWHSLYSDSPAVSSVVTGVHLVAMLFGGGFAVAADRSTLRALRREPAERVRALHELDAIHRPVLIALGALFASGVALAAADVETFAKSPVFILKLAIVALLLGNGAVLQRTERTLRVETGPPSRESRLWRRLRTTAYLSLLLWTSAVVVGTVLVNAA